MKIMIIATRLLWGTYAWAPAGGGKRGHLPPPGNSKIWGPPQG